MADKPARYAVYFAPQRDSAHAKFGAAWLGRDAFSDCLVTRPALPGFAPAQTDALTMRPATYGLHATLKAPFALNADHDFAALDAAMRGLAKTMDSFSFHVAVAEIDGFLAWRPVSENAAIGHIEAQCVQVFDPFRQPASPASIAKRREAGLSPTQDAMLLQWGYPYVLSEFRFHITLCDPLPAAQRQALRLALQAACAPFADEALRFNALDLFVQREEGGNFVHACRYGFDGKVQPSEC